MKVTMSSLREAPEISQDPTADNTDTYAFISPDDPDTVTIITNYIPLEAAAAGPNFYEFGSDVIYAIHIANANTGYPDITYEFRFVTEVRNPNTYFYNTAAITSLDDVTWNRPQFFTVTEVLGRANTGDTFNKLGRSRSLGVNLACPPCNVGPHSTPNYPALAQAAVHSVGDGIKVFAGQRNDGFFGDLGALFDLTDLRPLQSRHAAPLTDTAGVDTLNGDGINVHTIAMQIPIAQLTHRGVRPSRVTSPDATLGIWGASYRRKMRIMADQNQLSAEAGPWVQVSRLANPLFNTVLVGQGNKDRWNRSAPVGDSTFASGVMHPELARLLSRNYPGVFPHLAKLVASKRPRVDLEAMLLTGITSGRVKGFQNHTGKVQSDMLRLNVAIPPTASPNALGLFGGDLAGYPNGRRVADDVVTILLRAIGGAEYERFDKSYRPDSAATQLTQGVPTPATGAPGTARFMPSFPYLGIPNDGFNTPALPPGSSPAPTLSAPTLPLSLDRR
jgi:hypothetical protein